MNRRYSTQSVMHTCALRFNGWEYLDSLNRDTDKKIEFPALTKPLIGTEYLWDEPRKNLAAFFALQRWLCKWGGERLPETDPDWQAYRRLFLHLCREPRDPDFAMPEYVSQWNEIPDKRRESAIRLIRSLVARDIGSRTHSP
jgi:hypothetical protein